MAKIYIMHEHLQASPMSVVPHQEYGMTKSSIIIQLLLQQLSLAKLSVILPP